MYRFAPSPTGDMHIGNLRAAIINFVLAKSSNERFVLRIEDTDAARNQSGSSEAIKALLRAFGLEWDAEFLQSDNFGHHRRLAAHLLRSGKAFACTCTSEELEASRQEAISQKRAYRYSQKCAHEERSEEQIEALCLLLDAGAPLQIAGKDCVIRLHKPDKNIGYCDLLKGELDFAPNDIDSFVIMRQNGVPTYNFACCCDDICEGISTIIRGEDHVSNTPKQEHIRASLGVSEKVRYGHLPIILNEAGKKMSKRDDASSVNWLLEQGILPSAVVNYLLLLGNHPPKEIFTLDEAIEFFNLQSLSRSAASFDMAKLLFINREHLKLLDDEALARLVFKDEFLAQFSDAQIAAKALGELAKIYIEEASSVVQLSAKLAGFFLPARVIFKAHEEFLASAKTLANVLATNPEYADIKALSGLAGKQLFKPLRLLLSAAEQGPELAKIYEALRPIMGKILELRAL